MEVGLLLLIDGVVNVNVLVNFFFLIDLPSVDGVVLCATVVEFLLLLEYLLGPFTDEQ